MENYPLLSVLRMQSKKRDQVSSSVGFNGGRKSTILIFSINAVLVGAASTLSTVAGPEVSPKLATLAGVCVLLSIGAAGRFRTRMVPDLSGQLPRLAQTILAGLAFPFAILAVRGVAYINIQGFGLLAASLLGAAIVADWLSVFLIRFLRHRGMLRSRALLIGSGSLTNELAIELELRPDYGVDIVAVIENPSMDEDEIVEEMTEALVHSNADRILLAPIDAPWANPNAAVAAARAAVGMRVPFYVVPRLYQLGVGLDSMSPDRARGYPLVRLQRSAHPLLALRLKRMIDIAVAGTALLILSPLMLLVAGLVKISSAGPVLFRQPRVGAGGEVFEMLKFRSMRTAENEHAESTSGYRVTLVGRALRALAVDELPQLLNILLGHMTLVGPRPERLAFVEEGLSLHSGYAARHRMPMGLTGLAQVAGLRGEDTSIEERIKYDNLYIDQWSLVLDLEIVVKTVFAIIFQSRYRQQQKALDKALADVDEHSMEPLVGVMASDGQPDVDQPSRLVREEARPETAQEAAQSEGWIYADRSA